MEIFLNFWYNMQVNSKSYLLVCVEMISFSKLASTLTYNTTTLMNSRLEECLGGKQLL